MPPQRRAANQTSRKKVRAGRAGTRKPSVTIIGAGRLGSALAIALEQRGYTIDALVATTRAHARSSARLLRTPALALAADELDQLPDSRLVIIATPDDRISPTAARLAATLSALQRNELKHARVVLHVSGALSSDELAPLAARGFATGSLHPLVSVSDPATNARDFAGAYFCVEGEATALRTARALVRSLGGRVFTVAARDKALYHAAAVAASGHLVALFDLATDLLALCGLDHNEARRVLLPLARGTLSNLSHARANAAALTGPFARADAETISRHLKALAALDESDSDSFDARDAYALLGVRSLRLAEASGVDRSRLAEIADALASFVNRGS